ncbi:DNA-binding transcriptional regulator, MarR family [Raineyella antarctica]|uniref:DNA-binding transcriptional regulator, MarR family n=1 Tax=Raineyella antarctica TaxID=1577474 RepID=A0A1G6H714_9ACTN|nr:MarR family transcriptional regulator [Raineyella antarctica]SDB90057.1 DNA-binding transcriptional regulator, MarR family [Raineyella antarctica]
MPDTEQLLGLANDVRMVCQQISRRVRFESSTEIAPHQFSVLVKLRHRAWNPGELAELERVSAPSMTRTVNCLVDLGLVEKLADPEDGRQKLVRLTAAGTEVVERTVAARDTWMMQRLSELSLQDREKLAEAVRVLQGVLAR